MNENNQPATTDSGLNEFLAYHSKHFKHVDFASPRAREFAAEVVAFEQARQAAKGACSVGVGDGTGNLFVHGSYEAVKRVQAMVLELSQMTQQLFGQEQVVETLREGTVIDLDAADWASIQQAAAESSWIPPEYFRNDWVSDVCRFLRGNEPDKYDDVLLPFLAMMRGELHANAHKGDRPGWLQMDSKTAMLEVFYHLGKLHQAVHRGEAAAIKEYAADVANMCMMLVDVCGLLIETEQP